MNWEQIIQVSISNCNVSVTYDSVFHQYTIWIHSNKFRFMMNVEDAKELSIMLRGASNAMQSIIAFQTDRFGDKLYIDNVENGVRFIQFRRGFPIHFTISKDDVELMINVLEAISSFLDNCVLRVGTEKFGLVVTHVLAYTLQFLILGQYTNMTLEMLVNQLVDNEGPFMVIYDLLESMFLRKVSNSGDGDAGGLFLSKRMAMDLVSKGIPNSPVSSIVAHALIAKFI